MVPPAQAQSLRDALVAEGRHCEVRFFAGEGHGFRRAETLEAAFEAELGFYLRVLGALSRIPRAWPTGDPLCQAVGTPMSTPRSRFSAVRSLRDRALHRLRVDQSRGGGRHALRAGAAFAGLTILTSTLALYRQWAELAVGPFLFGTVCSVLLGPRGGAAGCRPEQWPGRPAVTWTVVAGSPWLSASSPAPPPSRWASRSSGAPTATPVRTSSPRSRTSNTAGQTVVKGKDPYHDVTNPHGKVVYHPPGVSDRELVRALPAPHDGVRHAQREEARHRPDRRPDLLQPGHPAGGRRRALPLPGRRAAQDARPPGHRHPPHGGAAAGHRRRRHAGGRLPPLGHGAGPAPPAVRLRAWCWGSCRP